MNRIIIMLLLVSANIFASNVSKIDHKPDIFTIVSKKFNVRESYLRGIAYTESGAWKGLRRRAWIRSRSGAIGIMQIMPRTAKHHCKGKNIYRIKDNIECGAIYIKWLQRHYCGNNLYCISGSYNRGPTGHKRNPYAKSTIKYYRKVLRGFNHTL